MVKPVRTYELEQGQSGEYVDAVIGTIRFEFPAGQVRPRSEGDELVLEQMLVPAGLAAVAGDDEGPRAFKATRRPDDDAPPEDATTAQVLEWVGEDLDRAETALVAEQLRDKPRKGVVAELEELLTEPVEDDDEHTDGDEAGDSATKSDEE